MKFFGYTRCASVVQQLFEIFRTSLIFSLWLVIIYMKKLHLSDWLKTSTLIMHHECRFMLKYKIVSMLPKFCLLTLLDEFFM